MKIPRRKRKVTTITLDPKIVKKAREYNLNISRLSEDTLKETIRKLEHEAKPIGAPRTGMKKGEVKKEMTSKLPWATAAVIIVVAAIGAWAIFGGAPAAPPGTATVTAISGPGTVFAGDVPAGTASGIENVYIIKHGLYTKTENLSGHAELLGVITTSGGSCDIAYETAFDIVVAAKVGTDNMAYAVLENMELELTVTGSFPIGAENCTDKNLFENSGYGTASGWIRVNNVWDNAGTGYKLPAGGSISLSPIKLWGWA